MPQARSTISTPHTPLSPICATAPPQLGWAADVGQQPAVHGAGSRSSSRVGRHGAQSTLPPLRFQAAVEDAQASAFAGELRERRGVSARGNRASALGCRCRRPTTPRTHHSHSSLPRETAAKPTTTVRCSSRLPPRNAYSATCKCCRHARRDELKNSPRGQQNRTACQHRTSTPRNQSPVPAIARRTRHALQGCVQLRRPSTTRRADWECFD